MKSEEIRWMIVWLYMLFLLAITWKPKCRKHNLPRLYYFRPELGCARCLEERFKRR